MEAGSQPGELPDELSAGLDSLGAHGRKAGKLLSTASWLLEAGEERAGISQAAARLVRAALDEVFGWAGKPERTGQWRTVSREVVDAKRRLLDSIEAGDGDAEKWLNEMLARIEEMGNFHNTEDDKAQKRAALLAHKLRGDAAPVDILAPVKQIAVLYQQATTSTYQDCSTEQARTLLAEVVSALRRLLHPPDMSDPDLQRLARIADPTEADVQLARTALPAMRDIEEFLGLVSSPAWLPRLDQTVSGGLGPPGPGGGRWVARNAVRRLAAAGHRDEVTAWVREVAGRCDGDEGKLRQIVAVLLDLDPPHIDGVLSVAGPVLADRHVQADICRALAETTDPTDDLVRRAAYQLLNSLAAAPAGHREIRVADEGRYRDGPMTFLGMLADGATPENAAARMDMLANKLRQAIRNRLATTGDQADEMSDRDLYPAEYSQAVPISGISEIDAENVRAVSPVAAIASCLVRIAIKTAEWSTTDELLAAISDIPEPLRRRLRTWILLKADSGHVEMMVAAVEEGIPARFPNCDDVALIDRAMALHGQEAAGAADCVGRWRAALGDPPSLDEALDAIDAGFGEALPPWWSRYSWSVLLPEPAVADWAASEGCELLATSYIRPRSRAEMAEVATDPSQSGIVSWSESVESPLDAARLAEMGPEAAAGEIASWRPGKDEWATSVSVLAQTLEGLVSADPQGWGAAPVRMVGLLRHPAYISSYLSAFASIPGDRLSQANLSGLISAAAIPARQPWAAEDLGGTVGDNPDAHHYDRDWDNARKSALSLLRQMIVTDTGLAGRDEEVWELLTSEAKTPLPRAISEDDNRLIAAMQNPDGDHTADPDPRTLAINRRNTRALEVALLLALRNRDNADGMTPEALGLVEWGLNQPGAEGAKCRSLIATAVGPLTVSNPDWVEANKGLLFGDEAGWLGQLTVDEAIKWGQPYQWLLANSRDAIYNAASRGIHRSLHWVLVAMLNGIDGYQPADVAERLADRIPSVCRVLAGLLDYPSTGEDTWDETADEFLAIVIAAHPRAIGHMVYAQKMPHDKWAALTLKALKATEGRIEEADWVLRRIFDNPLTPDAARIVVFLAQVQCNPQMAPSHDLGDSTIWERMTIAENAGQWLGPEAPDEDDACKRLRVVLKQHGLLREPPSQPEP